MLSAIDVLTFLLAFVVLAFIFSILMKLREGNIFKSRLKELMNYKETLLHEEENDVKKIYKSFQKSKFQFLRNFIDFLNFLGRNFLS